MKSVSISYAALGSSRSTRGFSALAARSSRRCLPSGRRVTPRAQQGGGPPEPFRRSPSQEAIKRLDDSVRGAQTDLGTSINDFFRPLGKAVGMGDRKKKFDGKAPKGKSWGATQAFLKSRDIQSVDGEAAQKLMKKGYLMVVVQPSEDFAKFHPVGAVNVPVYQYLNSPSTPIQAVRKLAFAAQGVTAIEDNPNFAEELRAVATSAKGLIFACNAGGTIRATPNFPLGQSSRSFIAASLALQDQELDKMPMVHLQGGLNIYFKQGFEGEGESDEWEDTSGRVPYIPGFTVDQDAKELMM